FLRVRRTEMPSLILGLLEVVSILVRKRNASLLTPANFTLALTSFRYEVVHSADYRKISVADTLVHASASLVEAYSINATDAVILQSALDAAVTLRAAGNDLVLVSSDKRLLKAAQAEGLRTFDPETQTQADLDTLLGP